MNEELKAAVLTCNKVLKKGCKVNEVFKALGDLLKILNNSIEENVNLINFNSIESDSVDSDIIGALSEYQLSTHNTEYGDIKRLTKRVEYLHGLEKLLEDERYKIPLYCQHRKNFDYVAQKVGVPEPCARNNCPRICPHWTPQKRGL